MSREGLTAVSHYFVMDWASVWMDIVGGLAIAGALAAWVPNAASPTAGHFPPYA